MCKSKTFSNDNHIIYSSIKHAQRGRVLRTILWSIFFMASHSQMKNRYFLGHPLQDKQTPILKIYLHDTDSPGDKIRIFATGTPCSHGPPLHDHLGHGPPSHGPVRHRMRTKADSIIRLMRRDGPPMRKNDLIKYKNFSNKNWQRINLSFIYSFIFYILVDDSVRIQNNILLKNRCQCFFSKNKNGEMLFWPAKTLIRRTMQRFYRNLIPYISAEVILGVTWRCPCIQRGVQKIFLF